MKLWLKIICYSILLIGSFGLSAAEEKSNNSSSVEINSPQVSQVSIDESEQLAYQLLVYQVLVQRNIGEIVQVDAEVQEKYATYGGYFMSSVPAALLGGVAVFLGQESLKKLRSILTPVEMLAKALLELSKQAIASSEKIFIALKLDFVLNKSIDGSELSFKKIIYPSFNFIGSLVNDAVLLGSAASSLSGIAGTSSFLVLNSSANKALTYKWVNKLLGQDKKIREKLDEMVENLSAVIELDANEKEIMRNEIFINIHAQAVETEFSANLEDYKIDVLQIMYDQSIISKESMETLKALEQVFSISVKSTSETSRNDQQSLFDNVRKIAALSAVLSKALLSEKITDKKLESNVELLLGRVEAKLKMIGYTAEAQ